MWFSIALSSTSLSPAALQQSTRVKREIDVAGKGPQSETGEWTGIPGEGHNLLIATT